MNKKLNKMLIAVFFLSVWCAPLISRNVELHCLVFAVLYVFAVVLLVLIKNKYAAFLISFILLIPAVIYHVDYLFSALCPFFVTVQYVTLYKSRQKVTVPDFVDKFFPWALISIPAGTVFLVYRLISPVEKFTEETARQLRITQPLIWILFLILLSYTLILFLKKDIWKPYNIFKESIKENLFRKGMKLTSCVALIAFVETIILHYITCSYTDTLNQYVIFLPWYIYNGLIVYYNDPVFNHIAESGEKLLKKM
ncbi:MAG: hypothetical protein E7573_06345 [Ruminococcaceae bacterium]|nr:hypothetical protein [Oscillospiraceae bacterium]